MLIHGVAYERDINNERADAHEFPELGLMRLSDRERATVDYHDPYVSSLSFDDGWKASVRLTPQVLETYDVAVIVTQHLGVNYPGVPKYAQTVVDTRNVTGNLPCETSTRPRDGWIAKA